ncbi:MAG: NAD(P)/FAD-dependent oxidoreductase [Candidatus Kapabacteria bacterium]|jgi:L-2-hydroxyglutarate oxidase LhgO|nr:NAD(P)/FAD-dependent oxidoreductase [Candidatus Kapabacteria bacterium]
MADYNVLIVGAGVVGLALAAKISSCGYSVLVVEKHKSFGNEISSRNSEVIHSGIYYEKDSLKANLCLSGNKLLYQWCNKYRVPFRKTGKFIIAVNDNEHEGIERLFRKGIENGVEDLFITDVDTVLKLNPGIVCSSALFSGNSGIVDSHKLMESFISVAKEHDSDIAYGHNVIKTELKDTAYQTHIECEGETFSVSSDFFINSAGLGADTIANNSGIDIDLHKYRIQYVKGSYFKIKSDLNNIVNNLIYPVPPVNFTGLGVHITIDMAGELKLGPDVEYLDSNLQDYKVNESLIHKFYDSASRFIPKLKMSDLTPDQAGIRPKLQKKGEPVRDFEINEESNKGFPKMINLIGIESPGLTSCIAIADYVYDNFIK